MNARILIAGALVLLVAGVATAAAVAGPGVLGFGRATHGNDGAHDCGDVAYREHGADHERRSHDGGHHGDGHARGEYDHGEDHTYPAHACAEPA